MRLEHFLRSAGGDIYVLSHCAADVFQHDHSLVTLVFLEVGIEYFCETETKLLSFLQSLEGDTRYAGEILSHVIDIYSRTWFTHALSRQNSIYFWRRVSLLHQMPVVVDVCAWSCCAESLI